MDRTILLVEHKMDVIRSLADRIIVLHNGALVADGDPAEVMAPCRAGSLSRGPGPRMS
jgi:branched-chain amino acid transport system ATP-binding protein